MNERVAMIIFDEPSAEDYKALHKSLTLNPRFIDWFHYINGMYLVYTDYTNVEISNIINPHLGVSRYIVMSWHPGDGWWGVLPDDAWEWLGKYGYGQLLPE